MSKITPEHLSRQAFVYVRQSTQDQLQHNHKSRRRQYALADRARKLGWSDVVVVDDDLGRSGGGVARPGFERLLVAICEGRVGIVLAGRSSGPVYRPALRQVTAHHNPAGDPPIESETLFRQTRPPHMFVLGLLVRSGIIGPVGS